MNREIKFRAWDKEGYMMDVVCIDFEKKIVKGRKTDGQEWTDNFNAYELLQWTGLLDKNGVECWEGDRVRFLSGMDSEEHESEVIYKNGAFREGYFNGVLALCPWFEVIGNIYENEA